MKKRTNEITLNWHNIAKHLAASLAAIVMGVTTSGNAQVIIDDPAGDSTGPLDVITVLAGFARSNVSFTAVFNSPTFNSGFRSFTFSLDTDQDSTTGDPPPSEFAGRDFAVTYSPLVDTNSPLRARLVEYPSRQTVGEIPFSFTASSVSVVVPLRLLRNDDGVVNVGVNVGYMGSRADGTPVMIRSDAVEIRGPSSPLPELNITVAGPEIHIRWPASATNYVLEAASAIEPSIQWNRVTNLVALVGTEAVIADSSLARTRFYRLRLQLPGN